MTFGESLRVMQCRLIGAPGSAGDGDAPGTRNENTPATQPLNLEDASTTMAVALLACLRVHVFLHIMQQSWLTRALQ